jgi:hypothetical protein
MMQKGMGKWRGLKCRKKATQQLQNQTPNIASLSAMLMKRLIIPASCATAGRPMLLLGWPSHLASKSESRQWIWAREEGGEGKGGEIEGGNGKKWNCHQCLCLLPFPPSHLLFLLLLWSFNRPFSFLYLHTFAFALEWFSMLTL